MDCVKEKDCSFAYDKAQQEGTIKQYILYTSVLETCWKP